MVNFVPEISKIFELMTKKVIRKILLLEVEIFSEICMEKWSFVPGPRFPRFQTRLMPLHC